MYFIKKSLILLTNERIYQKTFGARSDGLNPILAIVEPGGGGEAEEGRVLDERTYIQPPWGRILRSEDWWLWVFDARSPQKSFKKTVRGGYFNWLGPGERGHQVQRLCVQSEQDNLELEKWTLETKACFNISEHPCQAHGEITSLLSSSTVFLSSTPIILFRVPLVYPLISGNICQSKMEPSLHQYSQNRVCYVVFELPSSRRNFPSDKTQIVTKT